LLPSDERFFELFAAAAVNVSECAQRLRELLDSEGAGLDAVIECERRGDEITREILHRLNTS
jgi:uncharacterized protein Yka (UPF0111/DUF47 family)